MPPLTAPHIPGSGFLAGDALGWVALAALLTLGIVLTLWRWWVAVGAATLRAHPVGRWRRLAADDGTATIEFTLVFPILLVMILALIQTTLAFTGNLFVHYAAFAAARAAIVEVPRDLGAAERRNVVAATNSQKRENIRGVAAFALMPVSGPGDTGGGLPGNRPVGTVVDALYQAENLATPRWSESIVDRRLAYAFDHTDVELQALAGTGINELNPTGPINANGVRRLNAGNDFSVVVSPRGTNDIRYRYGPRDPIRVIVRHRFHLSVPFVGRLFGNGTHNVAGTTAPYRLLTGDFALTNEGIVTELPDKPRIPRGRE